MPNKVIYYQCSICGYVYPSEEDAKECELSHKDMKDLEVLEAKFSVDTYEENARGYPEKIRIIDSKRSGDMAEYSLTAVGSVEDFEPF